MASTRACSNVAVVLLVATLLEVAASSESEDSDCPVDGDGSAFYPDCMSSCTPAVYPDDWKDFFQIPIEKATEDDEVLYCNQLKCESYCAKSSGCIKKWESICNDTLKLFNSAPRTTKCDVQCSHGRRPATWSLLVLLCSVAAAVFSRLAV
eukprot:gnl/TRDRNA2_/TRDRNA2_182599_c0_seq1.p1 gnl/TRDRNA2_/TRDRNA2_182599_c0~~gnl/TRDRNA2_/TRDRNA2_182599_c0_seq1.p1  ORF type:complete len:174 (+),score=16.52 gnl/TRDRNA2_/TRDRNA2_182599_c0_seq1:70-522(+)